MADSTLMSTNKKYVQETDMYPVSLTLSFELNN